MTGEHHPGFPHWLQGAYGLPLPAKRGGYRWADTFTPREKNALTQSPPRSPRLCVYPAIPSTHFRLSQKIFVGFPCPRLFNG